MKFGDLQRRNALTRNERAAQARRRRALSHLERIQGRKAAPSGALRPRRLALPAFALSLLAGLWFGRAALSAGPLGVIAVSGAHALGAEEIARATGLLPGAALDALDREQVVRQLTSHAWIAAARTLPLPGGRLLVSVVERRAAAVLAGAEPWAVDVDGVPFAPAVVGGEAELPQLHMAVAPAHGEANADLAAAVALLRALPEHGLPSPREVSVAAPDDPQGFALRLPALAPEVVLGRDDLELRLAALRRLLDAGLPELGAAARIDLRFEDQAVLDVTPSQDGTAQAAAAHGVAPPSKTRPTG